MGCIVVIVRSFKISLLHVYSQRGVYGAVFRDIALLTRRVGDEL